MPARTTEAAVRNIISTSLDSAQVQVFIDDAALWVDEVLVPTGTLTVGRLELVERYLACALIRIRDLGLQEATFDDVREQYQVDPRVTDYLLRAAAFDPTGFVRQQFLVAASTGTTAVRMRFRVARGYAEE